MVIHEGVEAQDAEPILDQVLLVGEEYGGKAQRGEIPMIEV